MWRPPQNPLEEAAADTIAAELTGGKVYVLDRATSPRGRPWTRFARRSTSPPARSARWRWITNGLATKPAPPLSARSDGKSGRCRRTYREKPSAG